MEIALGVPGVRQVIGGLTLAKPVTAVDWPTSANTGQPQSPPPADQPPADGPA